MKKIAMTTIATTERIPPIGRPESRSKSAFSAITPSSGSTRPASPKISRYRPAPPITENQKKPTVVGTSSTPETNWRTVRPREMRAMNTPTKGAQETHQPQ